MDPSRFESSTGTAGGFTSHVHKLPLPPRAPPRKYADRFIPYRGGGNMEMAQGLLNIPTEKPMSGIVSPSREAYRKLLSDTMLQGRKRILCFCDQSSASNINSLPDFSDSTQVQPVPKVRSIPKGPERILPIRDMTDENWLHLFDWGSNNMFATAAGNFVNMTDATSLSTSSLLPVSASSGPVSCVSWSPDCRRIAVGLNNSHVIVYDPATKMPTRIFHGMHTHMVGSLAWNNCILTTTGAEGTIVNNDVRIKSHIVSRYKGHSSVVCGLKWSPSGNYLASGGTDKLLNIWDISKPNPLRRFTDHTAMVRALAWCPHESNTLASGGGKRDKSIKLWNTSTGACLESVDTGSEVLDLLWNNNARELLSSHGHAKNQLALWRYPSMVQMAELTGNKAPVPYLALSPDGYTVLSVSPRNQTMKFWHVFGIPPKKSTPKSSFDVGPCNMYSHIR